MIIRILTLASFALLASCHSTSSSHLQEAATEQAPERTKPIFPGCEEITDESEQFLCFQSSINEFIEDNFKTSQAMKQGSSGRAWVDFQIQKDGSVSNVQIARSSGNTLLDREAIRVISTLPTLTPPTEDGEPVQMRYTVPVIANW